MKSGTCPSMTKSRSEIVSGFRLNDKLGSPQIKPLWIFPSRSFVNRRGLTAENQDELGSKSLNIKKLHILPRQSLKIKKAFEINFIFK